MSRQENLSIVPARKGKAVRLSKGQGLKILNIHGHQVVDFWAFNADDPSEFISLEHTRADNLKYYASEGDPLLSNRRRPVMYFEKDTWGGRHDTLIAACDTYRYQGLGCTDYHENCTDNLHAALRAIGVNGTECPSPLNIWMFFPVDEEGGIIRGAPKGIQKDDYVILRAAMDCIAVMSCCPMDVFDIHGGGAKPADVAYAIIS
ncbi:DUF1989 domain-containing protein [Castellaniella sp.]|uniref:DUF1989 domain-containing protein n=1 Tax=Castellaniella sp. TaxID=1955812 RepID=UPI00355DCF5E